MDQLQLLVPAGRDGIDSQATQSGGKFAGEPVDGVNFLRIDLVDKLDQLIVVGVVAQWKRGVRSRLVTAT